MRHYKQLSIEDREKARVLLAQKMSFSKIARELGRSKSTITREIRRNSDEKGNYSAHSAQKKHEKRKKKCGAKKKLENKDIRKYVTERLAFRWSPEQIAERAKLEKQPFIVCSKTIYRAVDSGVLPEETKKIICFKWKNKSCKTVDSRGKIPDAVNISKRPRSAENRSRFGH